jgi:biopolymer transport protein ExbD
MSTLLKGSLSRTVLLTSLCLALAALTSAGCQQRSGDEAQTESPSHHDTQIIDLALQAGGLSLDGTPVGLDELGPRLEQVVDPEMPTVVIRVSGADVLPMGSLFAVQDRLEASGLRNMIYKTASGEELTLILPPPDTTVPGGEEHLARVRVSESGKVTVDGNETAGEEIQQAISSRLAGDDELVVVLALDPDATYGDFTRVLGAAKQAKAQRILLSNGAI